MKTILAILFLGIALIAGTVVDIYLSAAFILRGVEVNARIVRVDFEPSMQKKQAGSYYPVFAYVFNGKPQLQTSLTAYAGSPYEQGDTVRLLVDPHNPRYFVTPDFASRWGSAVVIAIFGLFFTGSGWVLLSSIRRA